MTLFCEPTLLQRVEDACKKVGRNRSDIMRQLLDEFAASKGF